MDVTGQQKEGAGLGFAMQSNGPLAQVAIGTHVGLGQMNSRIKVNGNQ